MSQCSINGTSVLGASNFLHIPVWQEGILRVPVDSEGHISVGLIGEQVHHTGEGKGPE